MIDKDIKSGTIFDEAGYDEKQKSESHEIGYRLFSIMFWVVLVFAAVFTAVCSNTNNIAGTVMSLVFVAVVYGFYVLYAYMTAKKGIMNPKFAKSWANNGIIILYVILGVMWIFRLITYIQDGGELYETANCVLWLILISESVLISLCAKLNNRILKKQLEENEEED